MTRSSPGCRTGPRVDPYFAFLNYYDAHDPYLSPGKPPHPFGRTPASSRDFATLRDWLEVVQEKAPRTDRRAGS